MGGIEWRRVAAPQADGYDIDVALGALAAGRYATRPAREVPATAVPVWAGSTARYVTLADNVSPSATFRDMPLDDPRVAEGIALLDLWPEGREQSRRMMLGLSPLTLGQPQQGHGCCCGNYGDDWGWIYVTADNPWGFAEGIVHETAHWKLRALGIWFEDWDDVLLMNDLSARYDSPVRKDITRPMGAVLHAQYSYVHVAKMCNEMLRATRVPEAQDIEWTDLQLKRIAEGKATLEEHAVGTPNVGAEFLAGFYDWTAEVMADGAVVVEDAKARLAGGVP